MTALSNVWALVRKEWHHYFGSPIAWVALAMWAFIFGFFFVVSFWYFLEWSMRAGQQMEFGAGPKVSINDMLFAPILRNMGVVGLFVLPMLTMRLFAEEKRQGTIELLRTSPITDWQIVIGKFLAAVGLYAAMILTGLVNFAVVWSYATVKPEWQPLLVGVLALLLVGASFLALGLFLSTLTQNQIIAGMVAFGLALIFWILSWMDRPTAGAAMRVLGYLGISNHMEDMTKGVLDLKDLVFYLSFIFFGLFLTHQSVESQRWRA